MRRDSLIPLVLLITAVGCGREASTVIPGSDAPDPSAVSMAIDPVVPQMMVVEQDLAVLPLAYQQGFNSKVVFPDGSMSPVQAAWSADAAIGTVSPASGSMTTLTTASVLPLGETEVHGLVVASASGADDAGAYVVVVDESAPIGDDDSHYKPCVDFTSDNTVVYKAKKESICPDKWAKVIEVLFPVGQGARVDFKDADQDVPGEDAPPVMGRLVVTIDHSTGRVTDAKWRGPNGGGAQNIATAVGKTQVTLRFPAGSAAEIQTVKYTGRDLDKNSFVSGSIPIPEIKARGKKLPINDIHISTRLHGGGM